MRCLQGIGVGGAGRRGADGGRAFAARAARSLRRLAADGVPAGLFLSTVVFGLVSNSLGEQAFLSWGWRLPFLLSVVLIAVGLFVRLASRCRPSPSSRCAQAEARPLVAAIRDYRRNLLLAMGMRVAENGLFYIYTVFVLSYGPGTWE